MNEFSELTLQKITKDGAYYVYGLIDPRNDRLFYIGKGTENRVFQHVKESNKNPEMEKEKIRTIREIEASGNQVKHILINWGLSESEAFASEASLINLMNYISDVSLSNIVAGHHAEECLDVEEIEMIYGAELLELEDLRHKMMIVKVNQRYDRTMSNKEVYDIVRGVWKAKLEKVEQVEYVLGVYRNLIVACYKPDRWYVVSDDTENALPNHIKAEEAEQLSKYKKQKRVFFETDDIDTLDDNQRFYLKKSTEELECIKVIQSFGYINM